MTHTRTILSAGLLALLGLVCGPLTNASQAKNTGAKSTDAKHSSHAERQQIEDAYRSLRPHGSRQP